MLFISIMCLISTLHYISTKLFKATLSPLNSYHSSTKWKKGQCYIMSKYEPDIFLQWVFWSSLLQYDSSKVVASQNPISPTKKGITERKERKKERKKKQINKLKKQRQKGRRKNIQKRRQKKIITFDNDGCIICLPHRICVCVCVCVCLFISSQL